MLFRTAGVCSKVADDDDDDGDDDDDDDDSDFQSNSKGNAFGSAETSSPVSRHPLPGFHQLVMVKLITVPLWCDDDDGAA